ncbi:hypothetical protein [Thiomicrorhabdus sediminis]|uniref:Uncharacterized protein n=1 Tax=Thiomicrorhabdus sediminis TaxID=2580412 RepID=A0A4P9K735_9GAMM|nr:hypothetical protein [Thiomicrorhabdus sediminis]QCU90902.1 hypothetical protein FE785_09815 [Thiomicrorhabdus sediminis]
MSHYNVEHNGQCYVVLKDGSEIMAFVDCAAAYEAKRNFEQKSIVPTVEKIPPAMRFAKQVLYGKAFG